jgi:hypothetical protein
VAFKVDQVNTTDKAPIEFDCSKFKVKLADNYSLLMLWEEGCFFQRLHNEHQLFPDAAPILSLVTIPYCALIEHDSIRFLREKCGVNLPYEGARINLLRNRAKLLDSKTDIKQYLSETRGLSDRISHHFKGHRGLLAPLANAIQPDIGIFYYKGLPIGSTHSFARYLEREPLSSNGQLFIEEASKTLGYQIGQSAAFLYTLAEILFPGQANTTPLEFKTRSNDTKANALVKTISIMGGGESSAAIFHLCSELMFQINALAALVDAKIITQRLWLKLIIACLFHGCNSIRSLVDFVHKPSSEVKIGGELEDALTSIFPREKRRRIERVKRIRNALVHYDFERLNLKDLQKDEDADYILIKAVEQTLDCGLDEFKDFLSRSAADARDRLADMLDFPHFNPSREPV